MVSNVDVPVLAAPDVIDLAERGLLGQFAGEARGVHALIVELPPADDRPFEPPPEVGTLPAVLVGVGDPAVTDLRLVDVVVPSIEEAHELIEQTAEVPLAAVSLALLLRHSDGRGIAAGLVAESATYSMLQAGPEFAAWRASRSPPPTRPAPEKPRVAVESDDDMISITLTREERHNAFDTAMLEELVAALGGAVARARDEPALRVSVHGQGPSFSSGGDLGEFGAFPDPVSAHAVRLTRSAGRLIAQIADRVEVHLHGWCLGAGIEVPAFATTIVADPGATIGLPELSLGLVPGAGGTVSLPRRIGRHRTALLALTGRHIDAATAAAWGLVERVEAAVHR